MQGGAGLSCGLSSAGPSWGLVTPEQETGSMERLGLQAGSQPVDLFTARAYSFRTVWGPLQWNPKQGGGGAHF